MEIPSGKVLAKPPVASLGCLTVMLNAKRRQSGIRVSIEPRNAFNISRGRPFSKSGRQYNTKQVGKALHYSCVVRDLIMIHNDYTMNGESQ